LGGSQEKRKYERGVITPEEEEISLTWRKSALPERWKEAKGELIRKERWKIITPGRALQKNNYRGRREV